MNIVQINLVEYYISVSFIKLLYRDEKGSRRNREKKS